MLKILLKSGIFYKMKIVKILKDFIRTNKIYKKIKFWKNIPLKDFFNFEKVVLFTKVYPYTMVSYQRLSNVYELAKSIEENKAEGDFVECGVWKGGCVAVMAYVAKKAESKRKIWLFDSFEGLPEPTKEDGATAFSYSGNKSDGNLKTIDKCVGPLEDVKKILFEILKIDSKNIVIEKGWFQDTLPLVKAKIGKISILRLDGDWYESTKCCLDNLYDSVIMGGYIILDDYGHWEGARKALDEFFVGKQISPNLVKIDDTGIYFKKV